MIRTDLSQTSVTAQECSMSRVEGELPEGVTRLRSAKTRSALPCRWAKRANDNFTRSSFAWGDGAFLGVAWSVEGDPCRGRESP